MSVEPDGSVRHEVVVDLPQEQAFWAFTDLDRIKPREHNMLAVPDRADRARAACRRRRLRPRRRRQHLPVGPRPDLRPAPHIAFSWDIGPDWQVATDLTRTSEVEVTFTARTTSAPWSPSSTATSSGTALGWESMRDGVDVEDGWPLYLARYRALTRSEKDRA